MSAATAKTTKLFVRRTSLEPGEYRANFRQIDCDVIAALVSDEACAVTSQMSKIYLSLINAPSELWEREGVLRLVGREREGKCLTAWQQLVSLAGVASATASKAFQWMTEQGIIGYFAGKNGVGIRIFINRAASSIRQRPNQPQKNLYLVPASYGASRTSTDEVPFNGSFASELLDIDLNPPAPKNGAAETYVSKEFLIQTPASSDDYSPQPQLMIASPSEQNHKDVINIAAVIEQIVREVIPKVKAAAAHENERTREWFNNQAMPKAIRIAQASAYEVLRSYGALANPHSGGQKRIHPDGRKVGKQISKSIPPRLLSDGEITNLAQSCVALLATQGQTIDRMLTEMSIEAGGFLLPEDAPKIRARAEDLALAGAVNQNSGREGNGH